MTLDRLALAQRIKSHFPNSLGSFIFLTSHFCRIRHGAAQFTVHSCTLSAAFRFFTRSAFGIYVYIGITLPWLYFTTGGVLVQDGIVYKFKSWKLCWTQKSVSRPWFVLTAGNGIWYDIYVGRLAAPFFLLKKRLRRKRFWGLGIWYFGSILSSVWWSGVFWDFLIVIFGRI